MPYVNVVEAVRVQLLATDWLIRIRLATDWMIRILLATDWMIRI